MDLFSLISALNPAKVKTETRPRAAHEVPLLTATANRVIDMEGTVRASESYGMPSTLKKSPLDFANKDPPQMIAESDGAEGQVHDELAHGNPFAEDLTIAKVMPEPSLEKEVAAIGASMNKRHRKRGKEETEANAPPKVLRNDHAAFHLAQGTLDGESPVPVGLDMGSIVFMTATQDVPTSVSDPDPLSYKKPQPHHERDIAYQDSQTRSKNPSEGEEIKRLDQEIKSLRAVEANSSGLRNQTKNLETMLEAEVDMKKAAEAKNAELAKELKSLCRCAEMDARLDKLRLAKGMSEGLKHGIEHGRVDRDLADIESFNPEADSKYVKALYDLKDLNSSQLNIHVYPEVRDPQDPWSFKDEILLEDAIAANISRAKKRKKCWVVCRTHGVGFAYHARSDGVSVSVPTIAPQGLHIMLADAATQTEISKDEASSRVLRSMSLPPMYSLDWL
nr:hypothetical protein [Tanacetum cinerariifolium]